MNNPHLTDRSVVFFRGLPSYHLTLTKRTSSYHSSYHRHGHDHDHGGHGHESHHNDADGDHTNDNDDDDGNGDEVATVPSISPSTPSTASMSSGDVLMVSESYPLLRAIRFDGCARVSMLCRRWIKSTHFTNDHNGGAASSSSSSSTMVDEWRTADDTSLTMSWSHINTLTPRTPSTPHFRSS
jgi:hypothetical protein